MDELGREVRVAPLGVGVRLGVDEHPAGERVGDLLPVRRAGEALLLLAAARRPLALGAALELVVDHRDERGEHRREAVGLALELAEHLGDGLDGGDAVVGGLLADPVVRRPARPEPDPRERLEQRVDPVDLLRERPGAVEHEQRRGRRVDQRRGIDRALSGEEHRRARGHERLDPRVVGEVDADVELGVREREVRHPRGAHRHPELSRVLEEDDAGARGQLRHPRAEAGGGRAEAAGTEGAGIQDAACLHHGGGDRIVARGTNAPRAGMRPGRRRAIVKQRLQSPSRPCAWPRRTPSDSPSPHLFVQGARMQTVKAWGAPAARKAARPAHHRAPRAAAARRRDRHPVLRRLPLRHPPGARRVVGRDLPDGAGPRDRRARRAGRRRGHAASRSATSRASAAWSTRAAPARPCEERPRAVLREGDRAAPTTAPRWTGRRRRTAATRREIVVDERVRAADPRRARPGGRRAAAVRGHHHLLAAAPVGLQAGRPRRRGRPRRPRAHGGEARGVDGRRGHGAQHLREQGGGRAAARRARLRR